MPAGAWRPLSRLPKLRSRAWRTSATACQVCGMSGCVGWGGPWSGGWVGGGAGGSAACMPVRCTLTAHCHRQPASCLLGRRAPLRTRQRTHAGHHPPCSGTALRSLPTLARVDRSLPAPTRPPAYATSPTGPTCSAASTPRASAPARPAASASRRPSSSPRLPGWTLSGWRPQRRASLSRWVLCCCCRCLLVVLPRVATAAAGAPATTVCTAGASAAATAPPLAALQPPPLLPPPPPPSPHASALPSPPCVVPQTISHPISIGAPAGAAGNW